MKKAQLSIAEKQAKKAAYNKAYRERKKLEMHIEESETPIAEEEAPEASTEPAKEKKVVAPKAEKEVVAKETIEILSALYGINSVKVEVKDNVIVGRKITNKMIGQDPAPKEKKELYVKAIVNGTEVEKTFAEGEKLKF